jgi:hypothetical protein
LSPHLLLDPPLSHCLFHAGAKKYNYGKWTENKAASAEEATPDRKNLTDA